jgi:hypothetical protein
LTPAGRTLGDHPAAFNRERVAAARGPAQLGCAGILSVGGRPPAGADAWRPAGAPTCPVYAAPSARSTTSGQRFVPHGGALQWLRRKHATFGVQGRFDTAGLLI